MTFIHPAPAATVYLVYNFFTSALFWMAFTVNGVYRVTVAGLDALQLVLVGTILEASVFLFEIPTGVVADTYSRRLSVIIGIFMVGAGFILEGSLPLFWAILLAQVIWGVGYTFTSGALEAWISDEVGEEQAGSHFMRGAKMGQLGSLLGVLVGTAAASYWQVNIPILMSGLLFIVFGGYLVLVMPEGGYHPVANSERKTWRSMLETLQRGLGLVRIRPDFRLILLTGLFFGMHSEGFDRLYVAHLLERFSFPYFQPVVWIGLMEAGSMLLGAAATGWIEHRFDLSQVRPVLRALSASTGVLLVSLALFGQITDLAQIMLLYWLIRILRQVNGPLYTAWVNRKLDSQVRATIISVSSQVDALGQIAGGPLIGAVARQTSLATGLLGSALLLSPALGLLIRQLLGTKPQTD